MKQIKTIITHPLTLVISFLFIMIVGQHLGGFYMLYILLALPHLGIHAVLAVLGIMILMVNNYMLHKPSAYVTIPLLNVIAALMLPLSLFLFFYLDYGHYNDGTFELVVPLTLIGIFIVLTIIFILKNLLKIFGKHPASYPG